MSKAIAGTIRVYRIYRELELNLRIKPRRRIQRDKPDALAAPKAVNRVWSMDFMSDSLSNGRSLRTFNVIDEKVNWRGQERPPWGAIIEKHWVSRWTSHYRVYA